MAIVNQIVKELAGAEDLLLGQGTVSQIRAGTAVVVSKVNADKIPFTGDVATNNLVSVATELNALNATKSPTGNLPLLVTGGIVTLSATQFANLSFDVTGVLTSNATIVVPDSFPQIIIIDNRTTGAFTLVVKNVTTPGVAIKQGSSALLYTTGLVCEVVAQTAVVNAIDVVNVPSGLVTETTVQDALNGLEARKLDASARTPQFTGAIVMAAMGTVPSGYLECNGALISRVTYANLFSQIGIVYGAGDGATTFGVPDFRGEFARGWDHGRGIDAGRGLGVSQLDAFKSHSHSVVSTGYRTNSFDSGTFVGNNTAGSTGATGGTETRPRNVAVMYVIKT